MTMRLITEIRASVKCLMERYLIDKFCDAYASTVELADKSLLITYYEEGNQSDVHVIRTNAPKQTNKTWNYANPVPLKRLTF